LPPHPALAKGKGSKEGEVKVFSFGEDLSEANCQTALNLPALIRIKRQSPFIISTFMKTQCEYDFVFEKEFVLFGL
jgi:hypothetical protein